MNYSTELNNALAEASTKEQWLSILQTAMGTNHKLVGRESSVAKVSISYSGLPVVNEYNVVIDLPYSAMNMSSGTTNLVWRLESTDGSVWAEFPYRFKMTNTPDPDKGLTFIRSIKIPAPSNLPEDETSLDWSGLPSSFSITVGNSVNLSSYVSYSGSGSLTYSSIGTSLTSTGITLNSSTGVLSISPEADGATISNVQIQVTDGSLTEDSSVFDIVIVTERLLYAEDLVRIGAFKLPSEVIYDPTYKDLWGFTMGLGFDPAGNSGVGSLFIHGRDEYAGYIGEVAIPTISTSTTLGDLPTASILQSQVDASEGTMPIVDNGMRGTGILVDGNDLVFSAVIYYTGGEGQSETHWRRPKNLADTGNVVGPVEITFTNAGNWSPEAAPWPHRFAAGHMCTVPSNWQTALGGPAITGIGGVPTMATNSEGPAAVVFDPADVGTDDPFSATVCLGYPDTRSLQRLLEGVVNPLQEGVATESWCDASNNRGMVFPDGADCVLFFGVHGYGEYWYGTGQNTDPEASHYDPTDTNQGGHAYPYRFQVWAYRAADLAAVKAGTKIHYQVEPYAIWSFELPLFSANPLTTRKEIRGCAYDPATQRVYLSVAGQDGGKAVIHVFELNTLE